MEPVSGATERDAKFEQTQSAKEKTKKFIFTK
jgi:hypothetical protein